MYIESESTKHHYVDPEFKETSLFAENIKIDNQINQADYPFRDNKYTD